MNVDVHLKPTTLEFVAPSLVLLAIRKDKHEELVATLAWNGEVFDLRVGDAVAVTMEATLSAKA